MKNKFTYGWFLVGYTALLFMLGAGITVDGLNVIVPGFAELRNWDYNSLLSYSSIGGIVGFLGTIFFAQLVLKKGVRFMTVIALILSGIDTIIYSMSSSIPMYIITLCILFFTVNGYSFIAPTTIITNWFPTKKGIAFGIATMGLPIATALFVPLLALLFSTIGVQSGLTAVGVFIIVLGFASIFIIKDTPEEMGLSPDGIQLSEDEIRKNKVRMESHITQWTVGKLLKSKAVWAISLSYGFIFLVTVGIISQLVPRVISLGYDQTKALFMLSLCAAVGIFGSFVWGWLDQKLSTKKASVILAVWYLIALVLLIFSKSSLPMLLFAVVMVGFGVGGIGNLQPSMVVQIFGRYEYASANRVVTPLIAIIRILAFAVVGIALTVTGNYEGAYAVLLVFNVIALVILWFINDESLEIETKM